MADNNGSPQNNDNRGRPFLGLFSFIIIAAVLSLMISFFVTNFSSRTNAVFYLTDLLNDKGQIQLKYEIFSVNEELNGNILTIRGYYFDGLNKTAAELDTKNIFSYSVSLYEKEYTTQKYTIVDSNGTPIDDKEYSLSDAFHKSVLTASEKYKNNDDWIKGKGRLGVIQQSVYTGSVFWNLLPTLIWIIVTIGIIIVISRLFRSSSGSQKQVFDFNKSRAKRVKSEVKFTDVAGCDEEKAEMTELVDYLRNPGKYKACGAKLPKGVILVGSPGTGKTLLAKAVAGEANVPFYSISGSDFVEMYVGVGAGRVRDMFKTAKQTAPCLVFIDEIDAVGRQRGTGLGGGNDEREQTLNQLLVEMDGFEENSGILVVAATNRDDVLDPALLRAGRFDRKITVPLPDLKGREQIFKVHARNKKIDESVDFEALAKRTVGFSGADIATILNDAAILSVRFGKEKIDMDLIDEAIDRRIAGPAKSNHALSELEKKTVAYHEAGHAVIGIRYPESDKVQRITIVPRGDTGGHVLITPDKDRYNYTKRQLLARIVSYLGGRTSEELFFDDITTGASNDIEIATRIARAMVVEYGMSDLGPIQYEAPGGNVFLGRDYTNSSRNFSSDVAKAIDKEVRKIIDDAHNEAKKYLEEYKDDVILIANTLLEKETITAEQINYLLEHRTLDGFGAPEKAEEQPVNQEEIKVEEPTNEVEISVEEPKENQEDNSNKNSENN